MTHTINTRLLLTAALVAAAFTTGGCQHMAGENVRMDQDYGASNRVLVRNQLADPEGSSTAGNAIVTGFDGQKSTGVMRSFRGDNATRDFGDAAVNTNSVTAGDN